MAAYLVFIREKTRVPKEFETYASQAGATTAGHTVKVLAFYGPQETMEGPASEGVVILEFPTMAEAKAWYESPAYREVRQHRFLGTDYRVILLEGVPPAG